mmetsp:Transcript_49330/g.114024  ORF Transcript_49330/g.114024 Transcript_49330/m.114024 type:complete len:216 (+) Transcript_49330:648-1295(+)
MARHPEGADPTAPTRPRPFAVLDLNPKLLPQLITQSVGCGEVPLLLRLDALRQDEIDLVDVDATRIVPCTLIVVPDPAKVPSFRKKPPRKVLLSETLIAPLIAAAVIAPVARRARGRAARCPGGALAIFGVVGVVFLGALLLSATLLLLALVRVVLLRLLLLPWLAVVVVVAVVVPSRLLLLLGLALLRFRVRLVVLLEALPAWLALLLIVRPHH